MVYEPRTYRLLHSLEGMERFQVTVEETDLDIAITKGRYFAGLPLLVTGLVKELRDTFWQYIGQDPDFLTTLAPHEPLPDAPAEVVEMCEASRLAGVGPMAAVAGLFSQKTGLLLNRYAEDVIVENGGDIWLQSRTTRKVAVFAGNSPFSLRIGLEIEADQTPLGICTSSGTVGHSLSFGKADAVVILAPSAVLADAVATASANLVQGPEDLEKAVNFALSLEGVTGALAIKDDKLAVRGAIKLIPME